MSLTCFVHLPLDRLHASGLLDDVVDELGRLFIPHLSLADPGLGEQAQQVGVDVVGIPADVGDMSEGEETMETTRYGLTNPVKQRGFGPQSRLIIVSASLSFLRYGAMNTKWRRDKNLHEVRLE